MRYYTTLIAGIVGILMMAVVAQGADKSIEWDAVPEAVSYRIEISTDVGVTWDQDFALFPASETSATLTLPDNVLVMLRAVSINADGREAINYSSGCWFNSAWVLPPAVVGLGISE